MFEDLKKALGVSEQQSASTIKRAPFANFIGSQSWYENLTSEQRERIVKEVEAHYEDEAVHNRRNEYLRRIQADKASTLQKDPRQLAREICEGFADQYGKTFAVLPPFQKAILRIVCAHYLKIEPKNFTFDAGKGVFVAGNSQIGKTSVFKYLQRFFKFSIATGYAMKEAYEADKNAVIARYCKPAVLLIDEVGRETQGHSYASHCDVVPRIVHARHERGLITHYTSNFTIDVLRKRYEEHIINRMLRNNIIEAEGADVFLNS